MAKTKALVLLLAFLLCSVTSVSVPTKSTLGDDSELSSLSLQKFQNHISSRLPIYKKVFEKYADHYDIPWTLIAAVAYQESKWDEHAVSHTGVRGIMQLTEQTAAHVGVEDRRNPVQSIRGGAYYLKYLYDKTPVNLEENLRWIQALAAYNIGWGHLRDAHRLGVKLKKNAYEWDDLKFLLPKLENEKYYSSLKYGFARGNETADFVDKVFAYYKVLNENFSENETIAGL